jgi:phosphatidylglycerophosphate synthase
VAEPPLGERPARGAHTVPHASGGQIAQRPAEQGPPLTVQRLFGLDRSGPPPPQTLAGAPLRPWTVPNAIGFLRLVLIPVFLIVALSSRDGTGAWPAALFGAIGWGDYADGITARVTRQYSRLGTLMDPVTDRLLVISGVAVCWRFALLPRWALAVLAARELLMLALGRYGQQRGVELRINWPGRLAVAPVLGSFFFAMAGLEGLGAALLIAGLALALLASGLYVRSGGRPGRAAGAAWRRPGPRGGRPPATLGHTLKLSFTFWSIVDVQPIWRRHRLRRSRRRKTHSRKRR